MKHSLDNGGEVVGTNVVVAMENLVDMGYILTMVADIDTTITSKIFNSLFSL